MLSLDVCTLSMTLMRAMIRHPHPTSCIRARLMILHLDLHLRNGNVASIQDANVNARTASTHIASHGQALPHIVNCTSFKVM